MTHDSWQISAPNYFTMPCIIIIRKKRKLFYYRTQGVDFMVGIITEGLLEIQVPFWTFHARLPPLGHFLPSATLIDWTRPCHPEVSDAACRLVRVELLMMMLNMEEPTNEGSMHMSRSLIRIIHSYFFNYPWRLDVAYVQYFGIISSEN